MTVDGKACRLELLDTGGLPEYNHLRDQWIRDSDGIVFVYSIMSRASFDCIEKFHQQTQRVKLEGAEKSRIPEDLFAGGSRRKRGLMPAAILVATKGDQATEREVSLLDGTNLANELGYDFLETSSRHNQHVDEVFCRLVTELREPGKRCGICTYVIEDYHSIRTPVCCHTFHAKCVETWVMGTSFRCPVCGKGFLSHRLRPDIDRLTMEQIERQIPSTRFSSRRCSDARKAQKAMSVKHHRQEEDAENPIVSQVPKDTEAAFPRLTLRPAGGLDMERMSPSSSSTLTPSDGLHPGKKAHSPSNLQIKILLIVQGDYLLGDYSDHFTSLIVPRSISYISLIDQIDAELVRLLPMTLASGYVNIWYVEEGPEICILNDKDVQMALTRIERKNLYQDYEVLHIK
jgi:hypothetical protein